MPEWFTPAAIVALIIVVLRASHNFTKWRGTVDESLKNLNAFAKEVRDDIKKIFHLLPAPTQAGASPFLLTEFGEKIAQAIKAEEWAATEVEKILESDMLPRPLHELRDFQIEAFCEKHIEQRSLEDDVVQGKLDEAIFTFAIERSRALPVLRLPLRDALLRRRNAERSQQGLSPLKPKV